MKLRLLVLTFLSLLTGVYSQAQEIETTETATPIATDTLIPVFNPETDSITSQPMVQSGLENQQFLDSMIPLEAVIASDLDRIYPEADVIDAAWQQELFQSQLYYWMRDDLKEDAPVDLFATLDKDTLRARLTTINQRTPMTVEYNDVLYNRINKYLGQNRVYQERLMALSRYYFPMFEERLDQFDIPLELKYLAIVESALKPNAKSRVGATGLWQFMYSTGKMYGLEVNSYVDDRMDPIKATVAACQYMERLYEIFEDWNLVLAAYNSGPGNVTKAIRRSGGYTNYWNLRPFLPRETAGYVPAFLAQMYLFEFSEAHGFEPHRPAVSYFETDTIAVRETLTFEHLSEAIDMSSQEIEFLNPQYKLGIIPKIDGKQYYLRLPVDAAARFVANEDALYAFAKAQLSTQEQPLPELVQESNMTTYRVQAGDYLGKIANRFGVTVRQLKRWNNLNSNNLRIGQRLKVRSRNAISSNTNLQPAPNTYVVRSGDSLWSIARKFEGVTVAQLRNLNNLDNDQLSIGMTLKIKS